MIKIGAKSSIVVDNSTFRFSRYRGSLCDIQGTEIQIYRIHVIKERYRIKFMTDKNFEAKRTAPECGKVEKYLFSIVVDKNLIHLERVERINFLSVKVTKRICICVILMI